MFSQNTTFREYILKSSESVETVDEMMPEEQCYRRAYIDLVPLNAFYIEGKYLFYDQEFSVKESKLSQKREIDTKTRLTL